MTVLVISGTGTEVGKTVVTAAIAVVSLAQGLSVAVLKPAQTGVAVDEPGDVAEVARLAGEGVTAAELARYPEPLAPAAAARRAGMRPVGTVETAEAAAKLAAAHDVVLVEGAGGLLVRYDEDGSTLADAAGALGAPVILVAPAGLGTLNSTALTAEALRARSLLCAGVVIGSWPADPGLADRCNLADLPAVADAPLLGAVPAGAGTLAPVAFRATAPEWLAAPLGGTWDAAAFTARWAPAQPTPTRRSALLPRAAVTARWPPPRPDGFR